MATVAAFHQVSQRTGYGILWLAVKAIEWHFYIVYLGIDNSYTRNYHNYTRIFFIYESLVLLDHGKR